MGNRAIKYISRQNPWNQPEVLDHRAVITRGKRRGLWEDRDFIGTLVVGAVC